MRFWEFVKNVLLEEQNIQGVSDSEESPQNESSQESNDQENTKDSPQNENSQESNNQENTIELEKNENNKEENKSDSIKQEKEKLEKLKEKALEYDKKKKEKEKKEKQNLEKSYLNNEEADIKEDENKDENFNEQTNNFLKQLGDLPSFKDRQTGDGYSIDTDGYTEIPDSLIRTLITKFLNQRFCKHKTDLNVRSNSLEKDKGFYKWEVKDVITHLKTNQITKVFDDKYGYKYADGKNEDVPLSFYFDMSGSMSEYTNMLAVIAIELLKKNVKVLAGFNQKVNVQIDSIDKNITVEELAEILESAGHINPWNYSSNNFINDPRVKYKFIKENLADYLISSKAEKCVVFSDFDSLNSVCRLSNNCDVYWFCFERHFDREDLNSYNGFIYKVRNAYDIASGLIKVNQNKFKSLCYTDNPKSVQRKIGGIK